jgi:hypothetical protein
MAAVALGGLRREVYPSIEDLKARSTLVGV